MSILDQIEKIQKKPDQVRKKIAIAATALSTGIVVLVWLTVANPLAVSSENTKDVGNDPFSILKDIKDTASAAGAAMSNFKEDFNQIKQYAEVLKQQVETATSTENKNLDLNK